MLLLTEEEIKTLCRYKPVKAAVEFSRLQDAVVNVRIEADKLAEALEQVQHYLGRCEWPAIQKYVNHKLKECRGEK